MQAICVKLVLTDPFLVSKGKGDTGVGENCYVCTLRIYPNTMFSEIKKAACEFWGKID